MTLETFNVIPDYDLSIMKEKQTLFDVTIKILDKMRYQQGTFILFNNYIIDNINTSIIHAKNGLFLTKMVIDKKIKKDIWEYLNKHEPEYKIKYLLNPYLIFNEI